MWTIRFLTRVSYKSIAVNCGQQQQRLRTHCWASSRNAISCENNRNFTFCNIIGRRWQTSLLANDSLLLDARICNFRTKCYPEYAGKSESKSAAVVEADIFGEASKLGLFAKFKLMYKKYWYVLLPVHIVTSLGWLGGFYYMSKSGVDIATLLQYLHLSETLIEKVQHSDMGHVAIAYLCYKVATPLRYAVTLGGTTLSIKHLVQLGYIKPMPSKDELMRMYEEQKATRAAVKAEKEKDKEEKEKENRRHEK